MEETHQRRCGTCGAEIQARHLGSVKLGDSDVAIDYCERCNAFGVPIGEDERTVLSTSALTASVPVSANYRVSSI